MNDLVISQNFSGNIGDLDKIVEEKLGHWFVLLIRSFSSDKLVMLNRSMYFMCKCTLNPNKIIGYRYFENRQDALEFRKRIESIKPLESRYVSVKRETAT